MAKEFKMSQARYDELKQELDYSKTTRADEVAELIKEARGFGDLSENSEYDEAKNEQGKLYSRIAELEAEAARWGLEPIAVQELRLALLPRLLDLQGDLRRATALLRADCVTADVYRAAAVLAGRVRYLTLAVGGGEEALARALRQRFGLCTGSVERPAVTVSFGGAPEDGGTICLGQDCRRWQRVTYGLAEDMPGPWPVSEQLLAVLFQAGEIKKEQIQVKTIAFNA